jgi:hypothetical protein
MVSELSGAANAPGAAATTATSLLLRIERTGSEITGAYSTDAGASWTTLATVSRTIQAPRLGIIVGGNESGGTPPVARIVRATVISG